MAKKTKQTEFDIQQLLDFKDSLVKKYNSNPDKQISDILINLDLIIMQVKTL